MQKAKRLIKQPDTLWNCGIFCFDGKWLSQSIKQKNPDLHSLMMRRGVSYSSIKGTEYSRGTLICYLYFPSRSLLLGYLMHVVVVYTRQRAQEELFQSLHPSI